MKIGEITQKDPATAWEIYDNYRRSLWGETGDPAADKGLAIGDAQETPESKRVNLTGGCQTCKNRTYKDGSDDPGVSFKTPTRITPEQAASKVRGHEMEHVTRERAKAYREDRKVVSQSVTYHTAICPECGRSYVAGGTTRTTTRGVSETPQQRAFDRYHKKNFEAFA